MNINKPKLKVGMRFYLALQQLERETFIRIPKGVYLTILDLEGENLTLDSIAEKSNCSIEIVDWVLKQAKRSRESLNLTKTNSLEGLLNTQKIIKEETTEEVSCDIIYKTGKVTVTPYNLLQCVKIFEKVNKVTISYNIKGKINLELTNLKVY